MEGAGGPLVWPTLVEPSADNSANSVGVRVATDSKEVRLPRRVRQPNWQSYREVSRWRASSAWKRSVRGVLKKSRPKHSPLSTGAPLPLPPGLLLLPLVFGILWDTIIWTSSCSVDGFLFLPGFTDDRVPLVDTFNFWMVSLMGAIPVFVSLFAFFAVVRGFETIVHAVSTEVGLDSAEAHNMLVKKGSTVSKLDVVSGALLVTCSVINFAGVLPRHFLYLFGLPQWVLYTAVALFNLIFLFYIPFVLRDFRAALLHREGPNILHYIEGARLKFGFGLGLSMICFVYVAFMMTTSPPFTEAILTTIGDDATVPCAIAHNASYVATHYRSYASATAACAAAQQYFLTIAKVYSALGTWLNGFCVVVIFELKHAVGGRETKFPRVQLAATLLLFITVMILTPVYISIMMLDRPDVRGWIMYFVHSMWATVVNIALFFVLLLMVNVELIYRRFEALLTGNTLQVCSEDGSKKDLCAEINRLIDAEIEEARRTGEEKAKIETRFTSAPCDLVCGQPKEAALGVNYYMKVSTTFQLPAAQVCAAPGLPSS